MRCAAFIVAALICASPAFAGAAQADAAMRAFADTCFSPFLTAKTAQEKLAGPSRQVEFYDLDPFSSATASPITGRAATPGTDRRCEVAFPGAHVDKAADITLQALSREGIVTDAALPDGFIATEGTTLLAARRLNPKRIAVVHVGTRPGPNGIETFMNVERLMPSDSTN